MVLRTSNNRRQNPARGFLDAPMERMVREEVTGPDAVLAISETRNQRNQLPGNLGVTTESFIGMKTGLSEALVSRREVASDAVVWAPLTI